MPNRRSGAPTSVPRARRSRDLPSGAGCAPQTDVRWRAGLAGVSCALAQDEAGRQQCDTAQQDRDRGEAGEGQLLLTAGALGAGLDLARGLRAVVVGAGGGAAAGVLLAEGALVALVFLALHAAVLALRGVVLLAREAADREGAAARAEQPAEYEHGDDRQP